MVVVLVSWSGLSAAATGFEMVTEATMTAKIMMENFAMAVRKDQDEVGGVGGELEGEQEKKKPSVSRHGNSNDNEDGLGKRNKANLSRTMIERFLAVLGWVRCGGHNTHDVDASA